MSADQPPSQPSKQTVRRVAELVAPWMLFNLMLLWAWRVRDIFNHIPGYEDVLEMLWGVLWYQESLFKAGQSPLFTSLICHPEGWHTATVGHTPTIFLLALPLYKMGGAAFAHNALSILSSFVAFAGALQFAPLFAPRLPATIAALVFTFMAWRWLRVSVGHVNMLWASGLLPWLLWGLESIRRSKKPARRPGHCRPALSHHLHPRRKLVCHLVPPHTDGGGGRRLLAAAHLC